MPPVLGKDERNLRVYSYISNGNVAFFVFFMDILQFEYANHPSCHT